MRADDVMTTFNGNGSREAEIEAFKRHLIEKAQDAGDRTITVEERALYALMTIPREAQDICSETDRETIIRTVTEAMRAAVRSAVERTEA